MKINNFFKIKKSLKIEEIAKILNSKDFIKSNDEVISSFSGIENVKPNSIAFLETKGVSSSLDRTKYIEMAKYIKGGTIITTEQTKDIFNDNVNIVIHPSPKKAYIKIINEMVEDVSFQNKGISPSANISKTAKIGKNTHIGHNTIIEDNVKIGDNCFIGHNCVIKAETEIGSNCVIKDTAVVGYTQMGNYCVIGEGAKIGNIGFGWASDANGHERVVHTGCVILEDFVEVDANSTVDRGTSNNTIIKSGSKIDKLCLIAHNVEIGHNCVIAGCVAIAGSTKLGNFVLIGGNTAVTGHINIGDFSQIAGMSGVIGNLPAKSNVWGTPAIDRKEKLKQSVILKRLAKK